MVLLNYKEAGLGLQGNLKVETQEEFCILLFLFPCMALAGGCHASRPTSTRCFLSVSRFLGGFKTLFSLCLLPPPSILCLCNRLKKKGRG